MSSMVAMKDIRVPSNVRKIPGVEDLENTPLSSFPLDEKAAIMSLAGSISEHGLLQPLVVKDLGKGKGYRLIAGFRRFKALQHNGAKRVDVKSVKGKTEDEAILKLVENIQREDLNPLDIAYGLQEIMQLKGITKQSALAELVKKSPGWVSQHLALLKADKEVQDAVASGEMGLAGARSISSLPKEEQAEATRDAKAAAKKAGKKKVSTKGAKSQAVKRKKKAKGKQLEIPPVVEREREQKTKVCQDFMGVHFGDKKPSKEDTELVEAFWDFLMEKNRLYIEP